MKKEYLQHIILVIGLILFVLGMYLLAQIERSLYSLENVKVLLMNMFAILSLSGLFVTLFQEVDLTRKYKVIYILAGIILSVLLFIVEKFTIITLTFSVSLLSSRLLKKGSGTIFILLSILVPFLIFYNNNSLTKTYFDTLFVNSTTKYTNVLLTSLYASYSEDLYNNIVDSLVQSFDYGYSTAALVSYNITYNYTLMQEILSHKSYYTSIFRDKVNEEVQNSKDKIIESLNFSDPLLKMYGILEEKYYGYLALFMSLAISVFIGIYIFITNIWSLIFGAIFYLYKKIRKKEEIVA